MVRITQGMRSSFALENPMVLFNKTHAGAVSLHFTASGFTHTLLSFIWMSKVRAVAENLDPEDLDHSTWGRPALVAG